MTGPVAPVGPSGPVGPVAPVVPAEETAHIVWVGHRPLDLRRHPQPEWAQPVRIPAHAFAPRLPHLDVVLPPV
ncbi:Hint domain-containing protein, partial [Methylobacterium platani]|uniref:Hint domain-containing protein n=1 Tax=Methylobacterium platani TaxID=427683 RepID=UPI000B27E226